MIKNVNHLTFAVKDLNRSFQFYTEILGFRPLAKWPEGAYLLAGELWICLSLDPLTRDVALPEYTHTAFTVSQKDFSLFSEKIRNSGAVIWKENSSPGESLYFLDPDGHKFEIHTSDWRTRIQIAKDEKWDDMEFFI